MTLVSALVAIIVSPSCRSQVDEAWFALPRELINVPDDP